MNLFMYKSYQVYLGGNFYSIHLYYNVRYTSFHAEYTWKKKLFSNENFVNENLPLY